MPKQRRPGGLRFGIGTVNPGKRRGFGGLHRRTPGHPDWLAGGPVWSEPVSGSKFPAIRENTGNCAILHPVELAPPGQHARDSAGFRRQFPKPPNREFSDRNREEFSTIREIWLPIRENPC